MGERFSSAFTLIELLVVISILGLLIGLSIFGLQGARESSRDAKRKADLELIRSGLEIYKADCNAYRVASGDAMIALDNSSSAIALVGTGTPSSCATANTYLADIPRDPLFASGRYYYYSSGSPGSTYVLCATLEQSPSPPLDTSGCGGCGSGFTCNYKVTNP